MLVTGGYGNGGSLASSELYDPVTEGWSVTTGALTTARDYHTATLLVSGKLLVVGGRGSNGVTATSELYN